MTPAADNLVALIGPTVKALHLAAEILPDEVAGFLHGEGCADMSPDELRKLFVIVREGGWYRALPREQMVRFLNDVGVAIGQTQALFQRMGVRA